MVFQLRSLPLSTDFQMKVRLERDENLLNCDFHLNGPLDQLQLNEHKATNTFTRDLWQSTCFELFFGKKNSPVYQEWNFSENGAYWVADFSDYRKLKDERPDLHYENLSLYKNEGSEIFIRLSLKFDQSFENIGVNAITQTKKAQSIYWALLHSNTDKADFHSSENRVVDLQSLFIQ